jgi:hypothetical protein
MKAAEMHSALCTMLDLDDLEQQIDRLVTSPVPKREESRRARASRSADLEIASFDASLCNANLPTATEGRSFRVPSFDRG